MMKRKERDQAKQVQRIAWKIQKANFAGIKLDSSQKKALSELVGSNFDDLTKLDTQMVALVPEDKVKSLRNGYTSSKKKGNSDADAMMMSMKSIGLSEQLQSQVMDLRNEQEAVYQEIASEVAGLFDEEQKKMLMAKMEEKEQMMAKEMTEKEEMAEKEMAEKEMTEKKGMESEENDSTVSVTVSLPGMT